MSTNISTFNFKPFYLWLLVIPQWNIAYQGSKKVSCRCPYYLRETYSQYLSESQKIVYMGHRCYILMKHQFWKMNDQFNGKTEKMHPPPHLIGHEVYEMVKDVHIVLGKWKMTYKNIEEDGMWKNHSIFWELPY
jgi:hypothetical protein